MPVQRENDSMKNIFLILTFITLQSCATIISLPHWHKKNAPVFYSGTRCDWGMMAENGIFEDPIYIIDLPFSFILDTVLLPISIPFSYAMSRLQRKLMEFAPYCYDGEE